MTRVGFVLNVSGQGWLGGVSYYRNLLGAILALPDRVIEPAIFTAQSAASVDGVRSVCAIDPIPTTYVDPLGPFWKLRRVLQVYAGRDVLFERIARAQQLSLLSHSGHLGRHSSVATLPWIPDFQELHYPEFFAEADRVARIRSAREAARHATAILLSSQSARADLLTLDGNLEGRTEVLRFVADVLPADKTPDLLSVQRKYGINSPYFLLPNQFWAHKNHGVVVEALALLKSRSFEPIVVATGNTADHRQAGHFPMLMQRVASLGLEQKFVPIGAIPYQDLMALMRGAVSLINPSFFEGWSTTVEEAKSLGKAIVLSDIGVHREQAPVRGRYFDPKRPEAAAAALEAEWAAFDPRRDQGGQQEAAQILMTRRLGFARDYQAIALRTIARLSA